jgi:hypothetical protein
MSAFVQGKFVSVWIRSARISGYLVRRADLDLLEIHLVAQGYGLGRKFDCLLTNRENLVMKRVQRTCEVLYQCNGCEEPQILRLCIRFRQDVHNQALWSETCSPD